MWANAGLHRSGPALEEAMRTLDTWSSSRPVATTVATVAPVATVATVAEREDANLLLLARLTVAAALVREESVGAHFRTDQHSRTDQPSRTDLPSNTDLSAARLHLPQKAMAH